MHLELREVKTAVMLEKLQALLKAKRNEATLPRKRKQYQHAINELVGAERTPDVVEAALKQQGRVVIDAKVLSVELRLPTKAACVVTGTLCRN